MFTTFKEIESYVLSQNMKKRIALANAHDEPALSAVVNAKRRGVGTLIGKKAEIIQMLHNMGESETDYEIIDFDGEELESAKKAIKILGGQVERTADYQIPGTEVVHRVIFIKKIAETPKKYPRPFAKIKKNPLYLNSKTIVVNCIQNRQSTLTKALYKQAEVGLEAILLLRCGYTQQDKSFRMQRIWDSAFNNQRMLKKTRKQVLSIFAGKLTPIKEC